MTSLHFKRSNRGALQALTRGAHRSALAVACAAVSTFAFAVPNTGPGTNPPPLDVKVSGTLTFHGCAPTPDEVTVHVTNPSKTGHPGPGLRLADGSIRMNYSVVVGKDNNPSLPAQFTVTPHVDSAACGSAGFAPTSRVAAQYATNANFDLQARSPVPHFIPVDTFLLFANGFLSQVRLHLNNDKVQSSFVTIGGVTSSFDIPVEKKDLPFPLPGSGLFYIRDMNLDSARMGRTGSALDVRLHFESNGIEVKGYHSALGDIAMPDFQMSNIDLGATASLGVRHGKLVLGFVGTHLDASVASTGACNVFSVDWCDFLFGASGSLRRSFELQAFSTLNGSTIQTALTQSLGDALTSQGIVGTIGSVALQGDLIVITTVQ